MQWLDYQPFRDLFAEALDERLYTIAYLDQLVLSDRVKVWTTKNAAIVAELKTYPTGATAVHGLVGCGDLEDIINILIPQAEGWGRSEGCLFVIIESREGWGRVLKSHGYEPFQSAIRKEL